MPKLHLQSISLLWYVEEIETGVKEVEESDGQAEV